MMIPISEDEWLWFQALHVEQLADIFSRLERFSIERIPAGKRGLAPASMSGARHLFRRPVYSIEICSSVIDFLGEAAHASAKTWDSRSEST